MTSRVRLVALVVAVLSAAACGQKPGVSGSAAPPAPAVGSAASEPLTSAGTGLGPETSAVTAPLVPSPSGEAAFAPSPVPGRAATATRPSAAATAGPAAGTAPVTAAAGSARPAGPAPAPESPAGPGPVAPPSGGAGTTSADDRTGVSDTEIVIGLHAPITGAAPVPQDSLEKAKGLYWRFVAEHGGVFGRNVRVIIKDDQFNPAHAVQVCREMVERDKVFLLMGIGTDQTIACARYASQAGVPYFATGGSQAGFAELSTYFNVSMTFPQQAPMVARLVQRANLTRVGVLTINTPNYNDTHSALESAARAAGLQVVRSSRINKSASQSETLAEANAMRTAGAEAVMMMVAPLVFLNLAHAAQGQAYNPMWTGPGLSNGLNLVAEFGCPSIGKATFLSPFPQLDVIDRFDADYKPMYRRVNGEEADDLGLALWGLDKTLHRFFEATGKDLSRPKFLATLRSGREFASNILPPVHYSPGNPFGASQAHVLEADCSSRTYKTLHTFVSSL
ncbi:MAG TPA: ABC transporter substrate-binding protein [Acidimicrobiia bacterium]